MNRIPSKSELRHYRCCYPSGTRIQLDADMDDPQPVLAGTKGTILAIDVIWLRRLWVGIMDGVYRSCLTLINSINSSWKTTKNS